MTLLMNREINDLRQRMNRAFDDGSSPRRSPGAWTPAVDVSEDEREIVLHVELPGMKKEEIEIQLTGDTIQISGERKIQELARGEHYHRIERSHGAFSRAFQIETPIDHAGVSAAYEEGVLTLRLPKQQVVKSRQIKIEAR